MASIQLVSRVFTLLGRNPEPSVQADPWGPIIDKIADAKTQIILNNSNWSFATRYEELAKSTTISNPEYTTEFPYGDEVSRVLEVFEPFTRSGVTRVGRPLQVWQYESSQGSVFTNNVDRIMIKFITRTVDVPTQNQEFIDAISFLSASECALVLMENTKLEQEFLQKYNLYKSIARANDIQQGQQRRWHKNRRIY